MKGLLFLMAFLMVGFVVASEDLCSNGEWDESETDVDCGGDCIPCPVGKLCHDSEDCRTSYCIGGVCSIDEKPYPKKVCVDKDKGISSYDADIAHYIIKGKEKSFKYDKCTGKKNKEDGTKQYLKEYYCDNNKIKTKKVACDLGCREQIVQVKGKYKKGGQCRLPSICEDGTDVGECAEETPKQCVIDCKNGNCEANLIDNCKECGCSEGFCFNSTCFPEQMRYCDDGIEVGECSVEKPDQCTLDCKDGNCEAKIIENCRECGCKYGYCINNTCVSSLQDYYCDDGTKYARCSENKPNFCSRSHNPVGEVSLRLSQWCSLCGCPENMICAAAGQCIPILSTIYDEKEIAKDFTLQRVAYDRFANWLKIDYSYTPLTNVTLYNESAYFVISILNSSYTWNEQNKISRSGNSSRIIRISEEELQEIKKLSPDKCVDMDIQYRIVTRPRNPIDSTPENETLLVINSTNNNICFDIFEDNTTFQVGVLQVVFPGWDLEKQKLCFTNKNTGGRFASTVRTSCDDSIFDYNYSEYNLKDILFSSDDYTTFRNISPAYSRANTTIEVRTYSLRSIGKFWERQLKKHKIANTIYGKSPRFNITFLDPVEKENTLESSDHGLVKEFFREAVRENSINTDPFDFMIYIQYNNLHDYSSFRRSFAAGRNSYISFSLSASDIFINKPYLTIVHEMGHQIFHAPDLYHGFGQKYPEGVPDLFEFPQKKSCIMGKGFGYKLRNASDSKVSTYSTWGASAKFYENISKDMFYTQDPENYVLCPVTITKIVGQENTNCPLQNYYANECGSCSSLNYLDCKSPKANFINETNFLNYTGFTNSNRYSVATLYFKYIGEPGYFNPKIREHVTIRFSIPGTDIQKNEHTYVYPFFEESDEERFYSFRYTDEMKEKILQVYPDGIVNFTISYQYDDTKLYFSVNSGTFDILADKYNHRE